MNIIDYVKNKNATFKAAPFNNVDALLFCQVFYAKVEVQIRDGAVVPGPEGVPLKEFYRAEYFPQMFGDGMTDHENELLFTAMCASPRFRDVRIKNIETDLDEESEKQFAAATFVLDDRTEFVAFRGTDGSMLGCKEDFNMAFMDEVPSQKAAAAYLNRYYGPDGQGQDKRIYVGGHSKGGTLAVYGSLKAGPAVRARLITVFSLEGPGFRDEVFQRLRAIEEAEGIRVIKIVPQASLVGMLMETQGKVLVVEAKAFGPMQHSAFTWQIEGDDFRYTELSNAGDFNKRVLHRWLERVSDEERALFVDRLFDLLFDNDIRSVSDIRRIGPSKVREVLESFSGMDEGSRQTMQNVLLQLGASAVQNIPSEDLRNAFDSIRNWYRESFGSTDGQRTENRVENRASDERGVEE